MLSFWQDERKNEPKEITSAEQLVGEKLRTVLFLVGLKSVSPTYQQWRPIACIRYLSLINTFHF
jgi:hypothetical protein